MQSLFFKFTDSIETIHIFTTLDKWATDSFGISGLFLWPGIFNAYMIGTAELIASLCLLVGWLTRYTLFIPIGAVVALSIISGAVFFHLASPLGVNVLDDGGLLFILACGVWISSAVLIFTHKHIFLQLIKR